MRGPYKYSKRATIGPPAKRHFTGVCRRWRDFRGGGGGGGPSHDPRLVFRKINKNECSNISNHPVYIVFYDRLSIGIHCHLN